MTAEEWRRLCDLVGSRVGQTVPEDRKPFVEYRLSTLATELRCASTADLLQTGHRRAEIEKRIVDAALVDETHFFRDPKYFEAIRKTILPILLAARRDEKALRIWSAACSTGQEPYSMAIMLAEELGRGTDWRLEILATDVSTQRLARAREGLYQPHELARGLTPEQIDRFFQATPEGHRVRAELRDRVTFEEHNLIETETQRFAQVDLVLLRHVILYMEETRRAEIFGRIARTLRAPGFLILGGVEAAITVPRGFARVPGLPSSLVIYQLGNLATRQLDPAFSGGHHEDDSHRR